MNRRFYRFTNAVMGTFYRIVFPARVEGRENIPAEGPFILCSNHLSNRDPFFLAVHCMPRYLYFMAKIELFKWKPMAKIVEALGGFPVDRGHSDLNAVRTALKILSEGHALALFPQGTRSRDNSRTPMLSGVAMIALRSGAPVIPAYIGGPYRPFRKTQLSFGKPVSFEGLGRRVDSETLKAATGRIEEAVWGLKKP